MTAAKGQIYAHHFRHFTKNIHDNETPLHQDTKWLFYQKLKDCIENNTAFPLNCECHSYGKEYTQIGYGISESIPLDTKYCPTLDINPFNERRRFVYNVVNGASEAHVEKTTKEGFKPDISLYDENDNIIVAVEIAHTHEDSDEKSEYYLEKGIDVIYVNVGTNDDLLDYHNNKYSKIIFKLHRRGCRIPIVTTPKMLIDNLRYRERLFQDKLNTALNRLFSDIDEYIYDIVREKVEEKICIAREQQEKMQRQREWERQKQIQEYKKSQKEERLKREQELKLDREKYRLQTEQKMASIEAKKKKLMALQTEGVCFNCGNEGRNKSSKNVTEINSQFVITINRCASCYNKYVSNPIDKKLEKAIEEILSE
ncbi:MAG: hypothetical protein JXA98_05415 [Methanosarcinaceae archaeon]|nr:hypothetical protein [Methanosarcinaceae archaeon]